MRGETAKEGGGEKARENESERASERKTEREIERTVEDGFGLCKRFAAVTEQMRTCERLG